MSKQQLGQFYTTNHEYILQGMEIPDDVQTIVEPFVGTGDLIDFIGDLDKYTLETYDIDPKYDGAVKQDTLLHPPDYDDKFVLTNPPYLARNKNKDKTLYDKYKCNDLYKCFIVNLIDSNCQGGIIIIPLNFISSIRKADIELRQRFFNKFNIDRVNIFEEQVFDDTTYTTCSIQFSTNRAQSTTFDVHIYPQNQTISIDLNKHNKFTIGGEIYMLQQNPKYKVERATRTRMCPPTRPQSAWPCERQEEPCRRRGRSARGRSGGRWRRGGQRDGSSSRWSRNVKAAAYATE